MSDRYDFEIVMVAAVPRNRVIGAGGDMPWRLPSDLKHFKAVTMGKPVVMGRKTFESLGRALPGRPNIVITRDADYSAEGAEVVQSLDAALDLAGAHAKKLDVDAVMIIGGGQIYQLAMGLADRLEITEVEAEPEGDTLFPEISEKEWCEVARLRGVRTEKDSADFTFVTYRKSRKSEGA